MDITVLFQVIISNSKRLGSGQKVEELFQCVLFVSSHGFLVGANSRYKQILFVHIQLSLIDRTLKEGFIDKVEQTKQNLIDKSKRLLKQC